MKTALEIFFLEHLSRYFRCSISGKNFNPIDRTVFEIQKSSKKRGGVPLNNREPAKKVRKKKLYVSTTNPRKKMSSEKRV
jgi:hypothetical protein